MLIKVGFNDFLQSDSSNENDRKKANLCIRSVARLAVNTYCCEQHLPERDDGLPVKSQTIMSIFKKKKTISEVKFRIFQLPALLSFVENAYSETEDRESLSDHDVKNGQH